MGTISDMDSAIINTLCNNNLLSHNDIKMTSILIISLAINGLYLATGDNMILEPLRLFIHKIVKSEYLRKPLIDCVTCMASVWGTIFYLLSEPFVWNEWIITVFAVAGLATLINRVIDRLEWQG